MASGLRESAPPADHWIAPLYASKTKTPWFIPGLIWPPYVSAKLRLGRPTPRGGGQGALGVRKKASRRGRCTSS